MILADPALSTEARFASLPGDTPKTPGGQGRSGKIVAMAGDEVFVRRGGGDGPAASVS
jgi:hypothetical protein